MSDVSWQDLYREALDDLWAIDVALGLDPRESDIEDTLEAIRKTHEAGKHTHRNEQGPPEPRQAL